MEDWHLCLPVRDYLDFCNQSGKAYTLQVALLWIESWTLLHGRQQEPEQQHLLLSAPDGKYYVYCLVLILNVMTAVCS